MSTKMVKRRVSKKNVSRDTSILRDYNKGMSNVDLVIKYKISQARIYQIIKKYEIS